MVLAIESKLASRASTPMSSSITRAMPNEELAGGHTVVLVQDVILASTDFHALRTATEQEPRTLPRLRALLG